MDYSIYDHVYAGMLKSASVFQSGGSLHRVEYHFDPQLQKVVSQYHLTEIAGDGPDSQKIIRMVEWMTRHCFHNGNYDNHIEPCAEKLLKFSFDQGEKNGINCLSLSTALTECLLGLGLYARTMSIMPMSPYDADNHVVCEAYAGDLGKWIMVDPTYGGYITDEQGTILNLMEMRERLANCQEIHYSSNYNYNGQPVDTAWLSVYYAKDLFYLQCYQIQGYHSSDRAENLRLTFAPVGMDVQAQAADHLQFTLDRFYSDPQQREAAYQRISKRMSSIILAYQHPDTLYQRAPL